MTKKMLGLLCMLPIVTLFIFLITVAITSSKGLALIPFGFVMLIILGLYGLSLYKDE